MDPLQGTPQEIATRIDPEDALRMLETSISTLQRHMRALQTAMDQLQAKRDALQSWSEPMEAVAVTVI